MRESNERLPDRLQKMKMENKALRHISAEYERVKRTFGSQEAEAAEAAKEREQAE